MNERVLIADGHAPTRDAVRAALEAAEFTICGEATDAESAVAVAHSEQPDIVLIEIRMPGNGLRAVSEIAPALPDTKVVVLTDSSEPADFVAAFRLGACGYVLKETAPDRLGHVLRAVLAGETAVPRSLVRLVIDEMRIRRSPNRLRLANERAVRLTDREWEVLELLREGCTTAEVAERLFVSQVTVRTHISGLQKKLQVKDRAAAIKLLEEVEARDEPDT